MEALKLAPPQVPNGLERAQELAQALLAECASSLKHWSPAQEIHQFRMCETSDRRSSIRKLAMAEYARRRRRSAAFGDYCFDGEPAWDMLLDLVIAGSGDRCLPTSSVCIGSASPPTTALRHLTLLEEAGLVESTRSRKDARVKLIGLTEKAWGMADEYFGAEGT